MKKTFKIEAKWEETARMVIIANSEEEAIAKAEASKNTYPSKCVSGSFQVEKIEELVGAMESEDFELIQDTWEVYPWTNNTGTIQVRVDNEYPELKEQLMAEDNSSTYWNDYRLEGEYEGEFILKSAGLYYSGENDFVLIRRLNSEELCKFQLAIELEKQHWA